MNNRDPRFLAGIRFFNDESFFEAHEAWEELWHDTRGPDRDFFQGLIQVASALHHLQIGNMRGARLLYDSGMELLAPYGAHHRGLNLEDLRSRFTHSLAPLLSVPPDQLAGRGGRGTIKTPYTCDRAFRLVLDDVPTRCP